MKRLRKSGGSSTATQRGWRKWLCVLLVLALLAAVVAMLFPRPERVELAPVSGGIDFSDPSIPVHTAADGVAVIRPGNQNERESVAPALSQDLPDTPADDAASAADGESSTYGGFTLPVAMDAGGSIGILSIPDLELSVGVYESDDAMEAMSKGVAHFKNTSNWIGNIGFSAHNINMDGTAGYFRDLYTLREGAAISYETAEGTRQYTVQSIAEIDESDWSGLTRTNDNRLTLITCISGKPEKRLMLTALEAAE